MPKKKKPYNLVRKIVVQLRAIHRSWPSANEALKKAKALEKNHYRCDECKKIVRKELIKKDHIDPIGSEPELVPGPSGGVWAPSWDSYISSFFSPVDNYQALCVICHDRKSKDEKAIRAQRKAKK